MICRGRAVNKSRSADDPDVEFSSCCKYVKKFIRENRINKVMRSHIGETILSKNNEWTTYQKIGHTRRTSQ